MTGSQAAPIPTSTGAAVEVEGLMGGRMTETPTGRSAPSNPSLILPEACPRPERAQLFSRPAAWIHPAHSGLTKTQIGSRSSGNRHTNPAGETLELLTQVSEETHISYVHFKGIDRPFYYNLKVLGYLKWLIQFKLVILFKLVMVLTSVKQ